MSNLYTHEIILLEKNYPKVEIAMIQFDGITLFNVCLLIVFRHLR